MVRGRDRRDAWDSYGVACDEGGPPKRGGCRSAVKKVQERKNGCQPQLAAYPGVGRWPLRMGHLSSRSADKYSA